VGRRRNGVCLRGREAHGTFLDQERLARFQAIADRFEEVTLVGVRLPADQAGVVPFEEVLHCDSVWPDAEIEPDQDACIFYTSGTTGKPKGAQLTHRSCIANVLNLVFMTGVQAEGTPSSRGC
jgi:Acyl-CoA synthetases (AMP-forming)/AMP-acid ligases II